MGKKQHHKDRLYVSQTEWRRDYGGHKESDPTQSASAVALPFTHCQLTLQPWTTPVATRDGHVFELAHIMRHIASHHTDPLTLTPLTVRDLIRLRFHKSADGHYACPITYRPFNEYSHIVFIRQTGNVYSAEAVQQHNIKANVLTDLLSGQTFTRDDIIDIQRNDGRVQARKQQSKRKESRDELSDINLSASAKQIMEEVNAQTSTSTLTTPSSSSSTTSSSSDAVRAISSSGHCSGSFTSTSLRPTTDNSRTELSDRDKREQWYDHIRTRQGKKATGKGYVKLITNIGVLDIELYCDLTPRTCHNFLTLCERRYYDRTVCHRLIPGFMAQFGDPDGDGRGGRGAFEEKFADEFVPQLTHSSRGVVSMANRGANTNGSQFFITLAACTHLDKKHTVFGRIIGGDDVLTRLDRVDTFNGTEKSNGVTKAKDFPKIRIEIAEIDVIANPFAGGYDARDEVTGQRESDLGSKSSAEQKEDDIVQSIIDSSRKRKVESTSTTDETSTSMDKNNDDNVALDKFKRLKQIRSSALSQSASLLSSTSRFHKSFDNF